MQLSRFILVAATLFADIACAQPEPERLVVDPIAVPLPVVIDERGDQPALLPVSYAEPLPAATLVIAPTAALQLDLFQAIETSLFQNPDLTALRRAEGVSVAALGVARTYPFNPFIQVQATPYQDAPQGAGPGTVSHYVLLMQQIQLGRQPRFREQAALAQLASVRWNIVQAELQNTAQTEQLYFTALYLRGLRDLAAAAAALNDRLREVSDRRLAAGDTSAADDAIVGLDHQTARQQARLAEANYQTALLDLRRQLNLPIHAPLELDADLLRAHWQLPAIADVGHDACPPTSAGFAIDDAMLANDLAASRPDVLAARADLAAANANVDLARGSRIPDLQIGPYYQRNEGGTTFVGFRAHADLPVWNNGMPLVRQRQAELRQRAAVVEQLHTRARLEVEAALDRYRRALTIGDDLEPIADEVLPDELAQLERQFTAGEVDVLRVTQARTSVLQLRRAQLDAWNEAAQAAAALTAAAGLPPETMLEADAAGR